MAARRSFFYRLDVSCSACAPRTLANEEVWRRTRRVAGPLLMLGCAVSLIAAFFHGTAPIVVFLAAIFVASPVPVVYAYVWFARLKG